MPTASTISFDFLIVQADFERVAPAIQRNPGNHWASETDPAPYRHFAIISKSLALTRFDMVVTKLWPKSNSPAMSSVNTGTLPALTSRSRKPDGPARSGCRLGWWKGNDPRRTPVSRWSTQHPRAGTGATGVGH